MKKTSRYLSSAWENILLLSGALIVLIPTSPLNMPLTYRDSGVFLYIGWRILNGEIPYRDVWDHKPPIIYYLNALGEFLTPRSRWGVWLIELAALFLAAWLGYHLIKRLLGTFPAIISSFLWLLTLVFLIEGGNLTTEYSLSLQFLALWLVYDSDKDDFSKWRLFLIGLLGALAFFTKQTTIGIWVAIFIYLTYHRFKYHQVRRWAWESMFLLAGVLSLTTAIVIYFAYHDALEYFWNAAFIYNFYYSSTLTGIKYRLIPIIGNFGDLKGTGIFYFSMVGYILGLIITTKKGILASGMPVLIIALIALPIEWIFVSASGFTNSHYLITILPVFSVFSGIIFWVIFTWLSSLTGNQTIKIYFLVGILGVFIWGSSFAYWKQAIDYKQVNGDALINYISSTTVEKDTVLVWGNETLINFFSRRASPSRFVYQSPLYNSMYADEHMIIEFLDDIIIKKPRLIIDTSNSSTPIFNFPIKTEATEILLQQIRSQYHPVQNPSGWKIYELTGSNKNP